MWCQVRLKGASDWQGIGEPPQIQRGSFDKPESYQGEESPRHNKTLYSEAPAQARRFWADKTLPAEIWQRWSGSCSPQLSCHIEQISALTFRTLLQSLDVFWKSRAEGETRPAKIRLDTCWFKIKLTDNYFIFISLSCLFFYLTIFL